MSWSGRLGVWLLMAAACAGAHAGARPDRWTEIRRTVTARMLQAKIPGLTVAAGVDAHLAWVEGFGTADLENSVPAGAETVYRIGSISKSITAVAAMQLAERGKLDLDAPIQKYVPAFPVKPWPLTVRELLAHLGGIRHYRTEAEATSARHYEDLIEPLKAFAAEPLLFEPGTRFSYSTYGYDLVGAAIEAASGMRFVDYLRANVFLPAGMKDTGADEVYRIVPHRARGYRRRLDGGIENCTPVDTSNKIPGGGLVSTAGDLIRFAAALERGELVKAETRDRMFAAGRTRDGRPVPYGLGWQIDEQGGRRWIMHTGIEPGASACLLLAPSGGVSVALLANLEGIDLEPLAVRIAEILLRSRD